MCIFNYLYRIHVNWMVLFQNMIGNIKFFGSKIFYMSYVFRTEFWFIVMFVQYILNYNNSMEHLHITRGMWVTGWMKCFQVAGYEEEWDPRWPDLIHIPGFSKIYLLFYFLKLFEEFRLFYMPLSQPYYWIFFQTSLGNWETE